MTSCDMISTSPSPRSQPLYSKPPAFNQRTTYRHGPKQSPTSSTTTSPQISPHSSSALVAVNKKHAATSTTDLQSFNQTTSTSPPSSPQQVNAGTQYTPPDWPPTSSRSSQRLATIAASDAPSKFELTTTTPGDLAAQQRRLHQAPPSSTQNVEAIQSVASAQQVDPPLSQHIHPKSPSEPQPHASPSPTLQNAIRRPLSADSDPATADSIGNKITDKNGLAGRAHSKRQRHKDSSSSKAPVVLPNDYSLCPPKTLAAIIASMLMRLIAHNDAIPLKDGHLTRFHSRAPPGISVHDYLARLTFHATLSPPIMLSMVFFIDRLSSYYPKFVINSLTVHRFLITAATVASKGLSDSFWTNPVYARVGGVSVKELALLELELLIQCHWRIVPKPQDLVEYYRGLVRQSDDFVLEEDMDSHELKKLRSNSDVEMVGVVASSPIEAPLQAKAPDTLEDEEQMDTAEADT